MTVTQSPRARHQAVAAKLARVRAGKSVRTLDLFSGCGGLYLGFHAAGFTMAVAVEVDPLAARTHGQNFFEADPRHAAAHHINALTPADLAAQCDLGKSLAGCIDVIVGGPPCQAFARVGRAKLREVDAHPQAFKHDARGNLYLRYLHYVEVFQPLALLIENVPDMMNYGGHSSIL